MLYRFEACALDVSLRELHRDGKTIRLERQVLGVLLYLIQQRARVVPRRELLDQLWEDSGASEGALTYSIAALRRATGDDGRAQRIVRTHHRFGYRFVANLTECASARTSQARFDDEVEARESFLG